MKKTGFLSFIICCGLTLIIVSGISGNLSAASMVTITVMEEVEIEKDTVLLGEIADIKGDDRELVQELRAIVMGRAPLPGKSRLMDRDYIKIRLKHERIDLSQIKLQAPGEIRISRGSIEFPVEKIKKGIFWMLNILMFVMRN